MKVRVLWVEPADRLFTLGEVYDLADGKDWIAAGSAEEVKDKDVDALADPRPVPEAEVVTGGDETTAGNA